MKINRERVEEMTIEEFADMHGLTMNVFERRVGIGDSMRFYAEFAKVDVMDGGCLRGVYGNGATEEQAIADCAKKISLERVVVNAMGTNRREIVVPRLIAREGKDDGP